MFVFGAWIAIRLALGRTRAARRSGCAACATSGSAVGWAAGGLRRLLARHDRCSPQIFGTPDDQALVTDIKAEDSTRRPDRLRRADLRRWRRSWRSCSSAASCSRVFARRLGRGRGARCSTGVVFGLGHAAGAAPIQLIALGAFGVGLCLLYWRTQSIIPCMALHALNNSITFGVVKELDPALFAGVVVVSVGIVVAGATAFSARPRWPHEAAGARAAALSRWPRCPPRPRPDPSGADADPGAHADARPPVPPRSSRSPPRTCSAASARRR